MANSPPPPPPSTTRPSPTGTATFRPPIYNLPNETLASFFDGYYRFTPRPPPSLSFTVIPEVNEVFSSRPYTLEFSRPLSCCRHPPELSFTFVPDKAAVSSWTDAPTWWAAITRAGALE